MTRLLVVEEVSWPYGGGGELATYLWLRLLPRRFHVTLLTARIGESIEQELRRLGVDIVKAGWLDVGSRLRVWRSMNRNYTEIERLVEAYDAVVVARLGYHAIRAAAEHGVRALVHLHDYVSIDPSGVYPSERYHRGSLLKLMGPRWWLRRLLATPFWRRYTRMLDNASSAVFVSKRQREIICRRRGNLCSPGYVVYNPPPPVMVAEAAPSWVPERFILYGGGPSPLKGSGMVEKLASILEGSGITVVAAGYPVERPVRKGNIVYAPRLRRKTYLSLLSLAEALLHPSIQEEPLPYSVMEAALLSKPVLATRVGGVPEILGHNYPLYIDSFEDRRLGMLVARVLGGGLEEAESYLRRRRALLAEMLSPERLLDEMSRAIKGGAM